MQVTESKEVNGKEYTRDLNETSKEEAQKYAPLHPLVTLVQSHCLTFIYRAGLKVSATASWGPASATVEGSFEASKMLKDFVSSMTEVTQETKSFWEKQETQDCTFPLPS